MAFETSAQNKAADFVERRKFPGLELCEDAPGRAKTKRHGLSFPRLELEGQWARLMRMQSASRRGHWGFVQKIAGQTVVVVAPPLSALKQLEDV